MHRPDNPLSVWTDPSRAFLSRTSLTVYPLFLVELVRMILQVLYCRMKSLRSSRAKVWSVSEKRAARANHKKTVGFDVLIPRNWGAPLGSVSRKDPVMGGFLYRGSHVV